MLRTSGSRTPLAALIAVAAVGLVGCSRAATEIACDRAEDLREGVADIDEETRNGDLDDARQAVTELRRDFDSLVRRMNAIDNTAEAAITPLLGQADEAIAVLEEAGTLDELSTSLDAGRGSIEAVAAETAAALSCD